MWPGPSRLPRAGPYQDYPGQGRASLLRPRAGPCLTPQTRLSLPLQVLQDKGRRASEPQSSTCIMGLSALPREATLNGYCDSRSPVLCTSRLLYRSSALPGMCWDHKSDDSTTWGPLLTVQFRERRTLSTLPHNSAHGS